MRSWRELALVAALAGCGVDIESVPPDADGVVVAPCETSYLNYNNFGEPFVINWCRGCHGSAVPKPMRQQAPVTVNFDSIGDIRHWMNRIVVRAGTARTMPPAGGPSDEERELLVAWMSCGAPD